MPLSDDSGKQSCAGNRIAIHYIEWTASYIGSILCE
jgi:hypothetical protein